MYLKDYAVCPYKEQVMLDVLKHINSVGSHPNRDNWTDYWSSFKKSDHPTYLLRDKVFRYKGEYVIANKDAEVDFFKELKTDLFKKYYHDVDTVVEFGCGSGSNLVQLHQMYSDKKLYGFDWAPSAVQVAGENEYVTAEVFDMLNPRKLTLPGKVGVLTSGSMEQLGEDFKPFLDFLLDLNPAICVHIEPIIELYDENSLFDYLAIMYHKKRKYLGRYLTQIKDRCVEVTRTGFGNLYNEGYNIVAWR
jgi:hypothetical protein